MTLSFSVFCASQTSIRSGSNRSSASRRFVWLPSNANKGSTLSVEFWGGRFDGISGTLGFALERRVPLMLTTMLTAAVGVNRTLLQRLLRRWAFVPTFRRGVFVSLDVSYSAAATLPPCRRCRVNGALLPLLQINLRGQNLCKTLCYGCISEWSASEAGVLVLGLELVCVPTWANPAEAP